MILIIYLQPFAVPNFIKLFRQVPRYYVSSDRALLTERPSIVAESVKRKVSAMQLCASVCPSVLFAMHLSLC
jgi:hypothetical protein